MEPKINFTTNSIVGVRKRYSQETFVAKITYLGSKSATVKFQSKEGLESISLYELSELEGLNLKEELLLLEGFKKEDNLFVSPDGLIIVSKNKEGSKKEWKIQIFNENKEIDLVANFNYIHELQFFCEYSDSNLYIKLGSVRILYEDF